LHFGISNETCSAYCSAYCSRDYLNLFKKAVKI
jgi:hypothetical protein